MLQPEDVRELSNHQWHEPTDIDEDWLITLFGVESSAEKALKAEKASSSSASAQPASVKPSEAIVAAEEEFEDPLVNPYGEEEADGDVENLEEGSKDGDADSTEMAIVPVKQQVIKPTYDFRRVYQKLLLLATSNQKAAKKLLLGLHEHFYHCPIMDFRNILIRCRMTPEVLSLAADAVAACEICRKYVRATRRPQVKTSLAVDCNETIQLDIFFYKGDPFLLIIDEATRYKSGGFLQSWELNTDSQVR